MINLIYSDWIKIRKHPQQIVLFILALFPIIYSMIMYTKYVVKEYNHGLDNDWMGVWMLASFFYVGFFLPVISGMVTAFLCQFENKTNWEIMHLSPNTNFKIVLSKVVSSVLLFSALHLIVLISLYLFGMYFDFTDPFPLLFMIKVFLLSVVATLPLITVQLLLFLFIKTSITFTFVNIILSLIGLFLFSEVKWGFGYIWSLPFKSIELVDQGILSIAILLVSIVAFTIGMILITVHYVKSLRKTV
ncbi:ABC transporter permease [Bacillus sp. IT-79MI2]|uniref:ABC transporter permease n=1 Tax=Bacillus TaxID=1386 RepID=UPI0039DF707B